MFNFNLPSDQQISDFQDAAVAATASSLKANLEVAVRVEGDGSPEDASITTLTKGNFKINIEGADPYSYRAILWVYVGSRDGSGSYGEWMTKLDDEWISTENVEDFDGSEGFFGWSV